MTGELALTDLINQVARDKARIDLSGGPTTREVATQLGVLEGYAERLLKAMERGNRATLTCGRWFARCDTVKT